MLKSLMRLGSLQAAARETLKQGRPKTPKRFLTTKPHYVLKRVYGKTDLVKYVLENSSEQRLLMKSPNYTVKLENGKAARVVRTDGQNGGPNQERRQADDKSTNFESNLQMNTGKEAMMQETVDSLVSNMTSLTNSNHEGDNLGHSLWIINGEAQIHQYPVSDQSGNNMVGEQLLVESNSLMINGKEETNWGRGLWLINGEAHICQYPISGNSGDNFVEEQLWVKWEGVEGNETLGSMWAKNNDKTDQLKDKEELWQEKRPKSPFNTDLSQHHLEILEYGANQTALEEIEGFCQEEVSRSSLIDVMETSAEKVRTGVENSGMNVKYWAPPARNISMSTWIKRGHLHPDLQQCSHPVYLQQRLYSSSSSVRTLDDMIARICGPKAHYFIKYNSSSSNENNNSDKKAPQNLNEVIQVILDPHYGSNKKATVVLKPPERTDKPRTFQYLHPPRKFVPLKDDVAILPLRKQDGVDDNHNAWKFLLLGLLGLIPLVCLIPWLAADPVDCPKRPPKIKKRKERGDVEVKAPPKPMVGGLTGHNYATALPMKATDLKKAPTVHGVPVKEDKCDGQVPSEAEKGWNKGGWEGTHLRRMDSPLVKRVAPFGKKDGAEDTGKTRYEGYGTDRKD